MMRREEKDQMGRTVHVPVRAQRIVSLVPSQTEFLHDLGLEEEVVGITKFCVHPKEWFRSKTRIGGTKNVNMAKVIALKPDLIIANKEENTEADIRQLEAICPVWISDVVDLDSALDMMRSIGRITDRKEVATTITTQIQKDFAALAVYPNTASVAYLIWKNPLMAAGKATFIDDMLQRCGFKNCVTKGRYPALEPDELLNLHPDVVLLSSEPFPFKGKHTAELRTTFPGLKFIEVDGELFSWYGSRLLQSTAYFRGLITELQAG